MLSTYRQHLSDRQALGIPPLPLSSQQTADLIELIKQQDAGLRLELMALLEHRVPVGVDLAAKVKASYLVAIAKGLEKSDWISKTYAVQLLGTMQGGYNVAPLVDLLADAELGAHAAENLKKIILIFDQFHRVVDLAIQGNSYAQSVLHSWAEAEWFTCKPKMAASIDLTVFKVPGETNTDDLSPAQDAWSRPDIPLHALVMLKNQRPSIQPDEAGKKGPIALLQTLRSAGRPLVYVGDVVGTGSSRKSATNSILWWMGQDIPFLPNKRSGGFCFGGKIAPIFYNTMEDSGAFPLELDVSGLEMGDHIVLAPYEGTVSKNGNIIANFEVKNKMLYDEVQAGGRIDLIIGRGITQKAREALGLAPSTCFILPDKKYSDTPAAYTLAQKMIGRACGLPEGQGVLPGTYCEPKMTSVGSQDTTGPMTRNELKDLACLGFNADLVMQSFCHTAAYPKEIDIKMHHELPPFMVDRGGVALKPGDGIIHSWLNRLLLPDTVGTGGDSHTRFPIGISFPAGSGLVAFAAATGVMPLDMPESVLVRFHGTMQPGITLRDLVNAIPLFAIKQGLLTIAKTNKQNIFSGRILEIEGLPNLKIEQAFEFSDASAERSAAACTVALNKEPVEEYLRSNIALMQWMIQEGYQDAKTLQRRIVAQKKWLEAPHLLKADANAQYAAVIDIDLDTIQEPILACPNDPDDVKFLSEVAGRSVDEVFIGSCMTNIGHFRASAQILQGKSNLPTRLWVVPPTKMDASELMEEGVYADFGQNGARLETPGCSLCMGNQARVRDGATVVSTSTRNFPNRMGKDANVFLSSAELAAVCALLGKIPSLAEYHTYTQKLQPQQEQVYRYLNFDQVARFASSIPVPT